MNYLFTLLPAANISTEGLKPRVAGYLHAGGRGQAERSEAFARKSNFYIFFP